MAIAKWFESIRQVLHERRARFNGNTTWSIRRDARHLSRCQSVQGSRERRCQTSHWQALRNHCENGRPSEFSFLDAKRSSHPQEGVHELAWRPNCASGRVLPLGQASCSCGVGAIERCVVACGRVAVRTDQTLRSTLIARVVYARIASRTVRYAKASKNPLHLQFLPLTSEIHVMQVRARSRGCAGSRKQPRPTWMWCKLRCRCFSALHGLFLSN